MGIFRRRKMDNAAAGFLPNLPPQNTTVHNHGINLPATIVVSVACGLGALPVLWWFLVALFGYLGSSQPEEEAAFWTLSAFIAPLAAWLIRWLLLVALDTWGAHRLAIEREITRREEIKLLSAQTTIDPGRFTEADFDWARVVLSVMMGAYEWREKNGDFPGRWRPWSLRSAMETANGIGVKLSQDRANAVSQWLYVKGVITSSDGGQIAAQFPNLSSVRALLDSEFGKPIVAVSPTLRDNRGFKHI